MEEEEEEEEEEGEEYERNWEENIMRRKKDMCREGIMCQRKGESVMLYRMVEYVGKTEVY